MNPYIILGIYSSSSKEDSSKEDAKKAFRKLAMLFMKKFFIAHALMVLISDALLFCELLLPAIFFIILRIMY